MSQKRTKPCDDENFWKRVRQTARSRRTESETDRARFADNEAMRAVNEAKRAARKAAWPIVKRPGREQASIVTALYGDRDTYLSRLPRDLIAYIILPMVTHRRTKIFAFRGVVRCAFCFEARQWNWGDDTNRSKCSRCCPTPHWRQRGKDWIACATCAADKQRVCLWCQHPEM
jgi:hypothetical protein